MARVAGTDIAINDFSMDCSLINPLVTTEDFPQGTNFNGNYYKDGGEIQFYAQAFGITASENKFERTGGLSAWARGYSGKDANLRNSFVDNEVSATAPFASSFLKEASKQLLRIVAGR